MVVPPGSNIIITFYDIPYSKPNASWSPNTLKIRYALNFKGIGYETVWVEYPDIAATCTKLRAEPTEGGQYTLPIIKDHSTRAAVSDSFKIAQYLDKTYPNLPKLFPSGTNALQETFQATFMANLDSWWAPLTAASINVLNPESEEYFRRTREATYGKKLEDLSPPGPVREEQLNRIRSSLDVIDGWFSQCPQGPYLMGETLSYGDIIVVSHLKWLSIVLPEEWASEIAMLHGGRWAQLVEVFDKYYPSK